MQAIATDKIHVWEHAGYGKAPFRVLGMIASPPRCPDAGGIGALDNYNAAVADFSAACRHHGVMISGACDVCGTAISNNYVVGSADNRKFVVGCDCVEKTGDRGMIEKVKVIQRDATRAKKEAIRQTEWERGAPEREAQQAERDRLQAIADCEKAAREVVIVEANRWLIDVLVAVPYRSDFVTSMVDSLKRNHLNDLSDRCVDVLCEIYSKSVGGRRNSKAYKAAEAAFQTKLDEGGVS